MDFSNGFTNGNSIPRECLATHLQYFKETTAQKLSTKIPTEGFFWNTITNKKNSAYIIL